MNIFNYFPEIIGAVFAAFIVGLMLRVASEGASLKTALLSPLRYMFLPLAMVLVIAGLHKSKRQVIFQVKQANFDDDTISTVEGVLKSKLSLTWFIVKSCFKFFRPLTDAFIRTSVRFEREKAANAAKRVLPKYQKHKEEEKFFAYFLRDSDVKNHLFNA